MTRKLILALLGFIMVLLCQAQSPVKWTFAAKKVGEGAYELHLQAALDPTWSIYSGQTPEGGPLPTKVSFQANPLVRITGEVQEAGNKKTKHEELFGVDVLYFKHSVDFVQTVTLKNTKVKTRVRGQVEFMACNDQQCLPPQRVPFAIPLN